MQELMFSLEEPHVRRSASPDFERGLLTLEATSPLRFLGLLQNIAPAGFCGKTSPEFCQTRPGLLAPSSLGWQNSGMGSPTAFLTLNTSEWPSAAVVCSLSDVLEDSGSVPPRFYLSAKACAGILRRAEKRGKDLPTMLHHALAQVAVALNAPEKPEDKTP